MRLLAVVGLLALALALSGCDEYVAEPQSSCSMPKDTAWTQMAVVNLKTGETEWVKFAAIVCPAKP